MTRLCATAGASWRALLFALIVIASVARAESELVEQTIAKIKPSVVAVGTFERTRSPPFQFRGTGFVVGDGSLIATNAHVLPDSIDATRREQIAILIPAEFREGVQPQVRVRAVTPAARDDAHDLALLRLDGPPMPALVIGDSSAVREGRAVYFTGFPIGSVLGAFAATHRATVAAITPIAIPQRRDAELRAATVHRLKLGAYPVFQLDGTAYPGNSGSPVFEARSGAVIGVINMVLVKATKESLLAQPSGIAYAIPAEHLRDLMATVR